MLLASILNAHSLKGFAKQDGEFIEIKSYESNASSDASKTKFDESEEDFGAYALKFILAFAGIGLFFGGIYLVKRGK